MRSNDCQTVAAHEASGGKSTERVQLQLHARVWTKTQLHWHARVWTKTQGRGRKLVAIQTVAPALPAADCVDRIEQRMQGLGWLCGTHCWTCLGLDCHEFRMRLQLHALCAIHTAITFPPLVSCTLTLTVVAPWHSVLSRNLSLSLSLWVCRRVSQGAVMPCSRAPTKTRGNPDRGTRVPAVHSTHPAADCMLPV